MKQDTVKDLYFLDHGCNKMPAQSFPHRDPKMMPLLSQGQKATGHILC